MNCKQLVTIGSKLPGVREGIWYRTPSLAVAGKSFCRLEEDGKDVVVFLVDSGHAAVLARLATLRAPEARGGSTGRGG